MSIIVSVKINDGVVMAADSATTFASGQIYHHADKIVNLVKGLPIGVMTCGAGGIGNESIMTLLKDIRLRLSTDGDDWQLDNNTYTIEQVTARIDQFFQQKAQKADFKHALLLRICGYSAGHRLPEVWQVAFDDNGQHVTAACIQPEDDFGIRWNGELEALNRLVLGIGRIPADASMALGMPPEQLEAVKSALIPHTYESLILPAAPIQDAIDLARFLVDVTKGFIRFSITKAKSVGGPIEIAVITKHEGFQWVQRKHFYSAALNR